MISVNFNNKNIFECQWYPLLQATLDRWDADQDRYLNKFRIYWHIHPI